MPKVFRPVILEWHGVETSSPCPNIIVEADGEFGRYRIVHNWQTGAATEVPFTYRNYAIATWPTRTVDLLGEGALYLFGKLFIDGIDEPGVGPRPFDLELLPAFAKEFAQVRAQMRRLETDFPGPATPY